MGALSAGGLISSIGTAASVIRTLDSAFSTFQSLTGADSKNQRAALRAQQDLALRQLQAQQGLAGANAAERAALDRQRLAAEAANSEDARRDSLRRAVARQNAQFGAQGLSAGDGSSEAVLLGMFEESEQERAKRERLDALRFQAIDQNLEQENRINVLQRAQLQERQNLERALAGY